MESPEEKEANRLRQEAFTAFAAGRFADAEKLFHKVVALNPTADDWYDLAVSLDNQNDRSRDQELMSYYGQVLRLDPAHKLARENLDQLRQWLARQQQADEDRRRRDEERQKLDEERRMRTAARAILNDQLQDFSARGARAYDQGLYAEAETAWRQYILLNPSASAWIKLGNALDMQGRDNDAIGAYQNAVALGSTIADANMRRTKRLMERARDRAIPVANIEESLSAVPELEDQGAFGQLLDVNFALSGSIPAGEGQLLQKSGEGFDTAGHRQRGRLLPRYSPSPEVEENQAYQETKKQLDDLEMQLAAAKSELFSKPGLTRNDCQESVRKMAEIRAKVVEVSFRRAVIADPKSLVPTPAKVERQKRRVNITR